MRPISIERQYHHTGTLNFFFSSVGVKCSMSNRGIVKIHNHLRHCPEWIITEHRQTGARIGCVDKKDLCRYVLHIVCA